MGNLKLQAGKKRLKKYLSASDDLEFLAMIWAIRAAQTGQIRNARKFLTGIPEEFVTRDITSPFYCYPWMLEDLLQEFYIVKKKK